MKKNRTWAVIICLAGFAIWVGIAWAGTYYHVDTSGNIYGTSINTNTVNANGGIVNNLTVNGVTFIGNSTVLNSSMWSLTNSGAQYNCTTGFGNIDNVGLVQSVTVPIGWRLSVTATAPAYVQNTTVNLGISKDGVLNDSTYASTSITSGNAIMPMTTSTFFNGDGASHTYSMVCNGTGSIRGHISNSTIDATANPSLSFWLMRQ
jgi:hypothetical protein